MTEHGEQSRIEADEARVALAGARWRARSRQVKLYRRVLLIVILVLAGGAHGLSQHVGSSGIEHLVLSTGSNRKGAAGPATGRPLS